LFRQVGAVLLAPDPIIGGRYEEPITLWAMVSRKSRIQDSRLECHWSTDGTLHSAGLELIQLLGSAMQLDILFLRYWRPSRCTRQPNDRALSCGRAVRLLPDHSTPARPSVSTRCSPASAHSHTQCDATKQPPTAH
jgi:hypothetical protein